MAYLPQSAIQAEIALQNQYGPFGKAVDSETDHWTTLNQESQNQQGLKEMSHGTLHNALSAEKLNHQGTDIHHDKWIGIP